MSNAEEYGYFAKNVAINLEVTTSTLRRWSIELEKAGYTFERNDKDQRIYYQHDINAFKRLKELISEGTTLIDAINAVVSIGSETIDGQKTPSVYQSETQSETGLSMQHLEEILDKKINKAVQEAYEYGRKQGQEEILKQIEKIEQRSNERDEKLMSMVRAIQEEKEEVRQLIATSQEKEKKSFWKRLFN